MAKRSRSRSSLNRRGETFSIEWEGMDEFLRLLEDMPEDMEREIKARLQKYAMLIEEGTKALAPHDRGDLEDSINAGTVHRDGQDFAFELGANSPYAVRQHEQPVRHGEFPKYENGAKFPNYFKDGLGARTRAKTWRGQRAGRKYMTRAIDLTEKDWDLLWEALLDEVMGGRRT